MKRLIMPSLSLIFTVAIIFFAACGTEAAGKLDRGKILKSKGVVGTFVLFKAESAWRKLESANKIPVLKKVKALMELYSDRVVVDAYSTLGLTNNSDFFLRIHSYDPLHSQQLIKELLSADILGPYFLIQDIRVGITKGLNYAHKTPDLLAQLKSMKFEGPPPTLGIMVTVNKTSGWWNLPENQRLTMIQEHTTATLEFIKSVKRKLYHSTGLGATDFLTYFETSDIKSFNELIITLKSIGEGRYTTYGAPIIGRITSIDSILR